MRITVTMQDDLVSDLMEITHARNKTQAVNRAIKDWLRYKKLQKIKTFRGKLNIENNLSEMNTLEIEEIKELDG